MVKRRELTGFTRDQHIDTANQLRVAEEALHTVLNAIADHYRLTGKEYRAAEKACKAMEAFRQRMDFTVEDENPHNYFRAYYPPWEKP